MVNPYTGESKSLKVKKVREGSVSLNAYMPIEDFNRLMGYDKAHFSGYFSNKKLDLDEKKLLSVVAQKLMGDSVDHFISKFGSVSGPIVIVSVLFFFVIIYLLSMTMVEKAKQDISYLKIFGYTDRESAGIYLRGTGLLLVAYLLVLPFLLKKLMVFFLRESMRKFDAYLAPYLPSYIYLLVILTCLLIFLVVQWLQMKKISKISMVAALKDITG